MTLADQGVRFRSGLRLRQVKRQVVAALKRINDIDRRRGMVPTHVPLRRARPDEVVKLAVERKHLTNLLKMVAFQAESDLARLLAPRYRRAEDEGRTLIQTVLAQAGDIRVEGNTLCAAIEPLSSPHRTTALASLCEVRRSGFSGHR